MPDFSRKIIYANCDYDLNYNRNRGGDFLVKLASGSAGAPENIECDDGVIQLTLLSC
ncbi:hypothetical protein BN1221_02682 [Brenneria goodwinii]|uniref:Uncharacterized protein n=1 Tax=Brenneria goodwinii TaxID=1109412 RepID=A0A0G4JWE4_9GAMM|nr:hypothetical protein BN1221_02682 [Brenneria goodwinii]